MRPEDELIELAARHRPRAKKKVDREALQSPFMRIPGMEVEAARSLLDLGIGEVYELCGRAPEALFEDARRRKPDTPEQQLALFRLAVYFAETPDPDPARLRKHVW